MLGLPSQETTLYDSKMEHILSKCQLIHITSIYKYNFSFSSHTDKEIHFGQHGRHLPCTCWATCTSFFLKICLLISENKNCQNLSPFSSNPDNSQQLLLVLFLFRSLNKSTLVNKLSKNNRYGIIIGSWSTYEITTSYFIPLFEYIFDHVLPRWYDSKQDK